MQSKNSTWWLPGYCALYTNGLSLVPAIQMVILASVPKHQNKCELILATLITAQKLLALYYLRRVTPVLELLVKCGALYYGSGQSFRCDMIKLILITEGLNQFVWWLCTGVQSFEYCLDSPGIYSVPMIITHALFIYGDQVYKSFGTREFILTAADAMVVIKVVNNLYYMIFRNDYAPDLGSYTTVGWLIQLTAWSLLTALGFATSRVRVTQQRFSSGEIIPPT